jgi:3-methyladenine DNA glycosylase AlkD
MQTDKARTSRPDCAGILAELRSQANPANVDGMARYGIRSANALGIAAPVLEEIARRVGRSHEVAVALWASGVFEARALAALVDDPAAVSEAQMEEWAGAFDSWAICDAVCSKLFDRTPFAWKKAVAWSRRREEYVKRGGFVLMAALAVHDKTAPDARFLRFLPIMEREATDGRNFVRKAVNWALRQIGKRNPALNRRAVQAARRIARQPASSARWIAADALRELTGETTVRRLRARAARDRRRTRPRG